MTEAPKTKAVPRVEVPLLELKAQDTSIQSTDSWVPATLHAGDAAPPAMPPVLIIEPSHGWVPINLRDLWQYRELLYFLVWRDIKVRYKQTVLGAAWAILQPVMTMAVFTVFFGRLGGMSKLADVPYPLFVFSALLPWTFFAQAVTHGGESLIAESRLITKVYFPRLIVPCAAVGGLLLDFALAFVIMVGMLSWWGVAPTVQVLLLPILFVAMIGAAIGVASFLSALTVAYRDFRYVVPFTVQLWMFASPVAYPLDIVPAAWQPLYALNPMAGIISGYRSALLGQSVAWIPLCVSLVATCVILLGGAAYFRRVERRFADIV